MSDKAMFLARAQREVERARTRLPNYAGECASCRWLRSGWLLDDATCNHPAVVCAAFNAADAYARKRLQECDEQRDTSCLYGPVLCGPDGALFEKKIRWWRWLFGASGAEQ